MSAVSKASSSSAMAKAPNKAESASKEDPFINEIVRNIFQTLAKDDNWKKCGICAEFSEKITDAHIKAIIKRIEQEATDKKIFKASKQYLYIKEPFKQEGARRLYFALPKLEDKEFFSKLTDPCLAVLLTGDEKRISISETGLCRVLSLPKPVEQSVLESPRNYLLALPPHLRQLLK